MSGLGAPARIASATGVPATFVTLPDANFCCLSSSSITGRDKIITSAVSPHAPWHPATGLGVCASCLSCLLVLISPFYEHRPYRTATAETRVLEDKTLIGAMVEIDANVEAFHVIDELGWDCRAAEVAKVGCDFHG